MSLGARTKSRRALGWIVGGVCAGLISVWATILAGSLLELHEMLTGTLDFRREPNQDTATTTGFEALSAPPVKSTEAPVLTDDTTYSASHEPEFGDQPAGMTYDETQEVFTGFGSDNPEAQREAAEVFEDRLTEFADRFNAQRPR